MRKPIYPGHWSGQLSSLNSRRFWPINTVWHWNDGKFTICPIGNYGNLQSKDSDSFCFLIALHIDYQHVWGDPVFVFLHDSWSSCRADLVSYLVSLSIENYKIGKVETIC